MVKIALVNLKQPAAGQISHALAVSSRQLIQYQEQDNVIRELSDVGIVFAGGEPADYLRLLRRVRKVRTTMPFIVVAPIPSVIEWLNTLEAGATDCCSEPIDTRQLRWLMQPALPRYNHGGR
jgi:DNA-binding response OmpR family regulator